MGSLRFGQWAWGQCARIQCAWIVVSISCLVFLPGCGGHKPPGGPSFAARVNLNPPISLSMQLGTVVVFTASAQNGGGAAIRTSFVYTSNNPSIVDVAPNGAACAGTWNAPLYTVCAPGAAGVAQVTATAGGVSSAPTYVFVHPFISSIQVSVVPPVNSPPPACPAQVALPAACDLPFKATNSCLSQNQILTLQATALDNGGNDVTSSVGPFFWSQGNAGVATLTPIVTVTYDNVPTNQAIAAPNTPGQTQVIASASGVSSQPFDFETCPVQCISLALNVSGEQQSDLTNFVVSKGTSQTVTATAVDVQGCIVPKAPLTWLSSEPAALGAGAGSASCGAAGSPTCSIATTQPGVAAITASCTPPTCNIGFPLNLNPSVTAPYIPEPVYPVTAISGLVTGAASTTGVLATSQDCYSNILCQVGMYNVSTSTNLPGPAFELPTPPNSLMFDLAGDKAYMGSEFGAFSISVGSFGGSSSPFSPLGAPGTTRGVVTGNVLAVSHTGTQAIFSDTIATPNQVYVVNGSSSIPLNINSATAAAFSPDSMETFLLGNGGKTLYSYSTLQYQQVVQPNPLPTPATSIVFNSTGSFALLSGGSPTGTLAVYDTCDNSLVLPYLSAPAILSPPLFLRMVPSGNVPMGNTIIPNLQTQGLDFFYGIDNTGIDIIATTSSQGPLTTLCPQQVTLAQLQPATAPPTFFLPTHINIGQGTFQPINFFLSPDATRAYIIASDLGVLVYDFNTTSTSRILLANNASPVAADITVDGSLIYVAGSDGQLHEVNTALAVDRMEVSFPPLVNSTNNFCYTGSNCALNIVAIRP
jgi:hypothetical protein